MDYFKEFAPNFYSAAPVDRLWHRRADQEWLEAALRNPHTRFLPVWQAKNLVTPDQEPHPLELTAAQVANAVCDTGTLVLLGDWNNRIYFAVDLATNGSTAPARFAELGRFRDLRVLGPLLDHREAALLAYARAITYWHGQNRFCGTCGAATKSAHAGHMRTCTNEGCAKEHFPRTDPAIIVLITCGASCLLGRQPQWPEKMYSTIAGFVEPGESLEDAVMREASEETGIHIKQLCYRSSQPWPFPCSIMLGFRAEAANHEIQLKDQELEDARWFSRDEIETALRGGHLRLPTAVSIAYRLIEEWFNEEHSEGLHSLLR
ncbi:NAD(+) diphosphatase [Desulfoferrobacter suflitae]|uniref:NAD(+) diphosphatase n=1 Tax=Desulfoferrobacter suflitae TaxID=2865782 RepID=UPI00216486B2|nr:NAD(+) diphosphatase [Desulfoferrobacter suflitae]MCK8600388.1 NAD(+) diphosphatase [Desulfoferrobacter suflitae]